MADTAASTEATEEIDGTEATEPSQQTQTGSAPTAEMDKFRDTLHGILEEVATTVMAVEEGKPQDQKEMEANIDVLFPDELLWRTVSEVLNKKIREQEEALPRQYIVCSFDDREEAKKLGARWDPEKKKWYALGDAAYAKLARWHPRAPAGAPPSSVPPSPSPAAGGPVHRTPAHRAHGTSPYTREDMARFRK